MANIVTTTVLGDGASNVLQVVTGVLDTSDYPSTSITNRLALVPVPPMLRLDMIFFSIEDGLTCMLWWEANVDALILPLAGRGKFDFDWFAGWTNPKPAGYTGDIKLSTSGWSGLKHFTLMLEYTKQGV